MRISKTIFFESNPLMGPQDLRELGKIAGSARGVPMAAEHWRRFGASDIQARSLELWSAMRGKVEDFEAMAQGMERAKTARVFRAKEGSGLERELAPGSAIVGEEREGGMLIHYEGNIYGASNLNEFHERAAHAAGRLFENYPTVAKSFLSGDRVAEELEPVGTIDNYSYRIRAEEPAPATPARSKPKA